MQEIQRIEAQPTMAADVFTRFIKFIDAAPNTVESYRKDIKQFAKWLSQNRITAPTRQDIITYRDNLKINHKPTTVQNYITAVKIFFSWTEQEGIYPNIAKHVKGAKLDREHKKDYLTADQVKTILNDMDRKSDQGRRDYAIFILMVTGGLRTIEIQRANIEDLRTSGGVPVLYVQGKGHTERNEFIKVIPQAEAAIRDYLKTRPEATGSAPLFASLSHNNLGGRMTTRSISQICKNAMKAAGYNTPRLTAHSLRHTAVTLALLGGATLQEAQAFARHANITTTEIYAHNIDRISNPCEGNIARAIF
jgi:integrase/recombinase XerD